MKQFKIRGSGAGNIMNVRGLGKTGENYCVSWYKEQLYKRRKEIHSKYLSKGLITEDNSIDFVSEYLGLGFLMKNEEYFENEYMTGTPDVIVRSENLIIDVKNSWDFTTFPLFEKEVPNDGYLYQAQIYMHLVGIDNFKLIYTLSNTPVNLIEQEAKSYCWKNGYGELDADIYQQFKQKMTYDDIPDDLKIKIFDIKKDDAIINKIIERVKECREFIKTLDDAIKINK